ncbi:MAG: hypothetical protein LQ338_004257 [Usnochroma carphineum]|nr:MAG: hypothetical protein LQ338_005245 [Usnochroma carphineum]KAI4125424.1 MAG: hypothetical protein LQ338_004257 [Usnochroma carphineum]
MAGQDGKPAMSADVDREKAGNFSQEKPTIQQVPQQDNGPRDPGASQPTPKPPYSAFSPGRRRFILGIVTATGFFGPLAGGIYLPALPTLQRSFHTSSTTINATVSVFMAILSIAPLFWGSLADYGGRKPLYMASLLIYIASNILMAAIPANLAAIFILRVVQGIGAAAGLSLAAGTVADITEPKKRASSMSIVLLGPQLGPVLGPLLGGAITGSAGWRWTFGFLVDPAKFPRPPPPTLVSLIKLLRYPPITIVSLNNALLFAAYYGMNVTLPSFLENRYGFTSTQVGVAYLAPGLSLMAGSLLSGRISDFHRARFVKRSPDSPPHAEHRLHLQIPGVIVSLSGTLMYGWFVHFHVHVAAVLVSTGIGESPCALFLVLDDGGES